MLIKTNYYYCCDIWFPCASLTNWNTVTSNNTIITTAASGETESRHMIYSLKKACMCVGGELQTHSGTTAVVCIL